MEVHVFMSLVTTLIRERSRGARGSPDFVIAWNRLSQEGDYTDDEIESLIQNWNHLPGGQSDLLGQS